MTAPQPPLPGHAGEPSGDPSMEDILASIRRILSEDEAKAEASAPGSSAAAHGGADDVLLLDSSMMVEVPAPPSMQAATGHAETPVAPPAPIVAPVAPSPPPASPSAASPPVEPVVEAARPAPVPVPHAVAETLVAPEAAAAAATSVGALLRHLQVERQTAVHRGGPTIEDIVREEMRPILKDWLDAHLPPLVERLVRSEIERVVARSIP